ncbi:hypothetical protein [Paenibacillus lactis]|uniref:hypothetical protein n=1 Tax=Paenibacillus lactis TaxID=228574 RepID=UPI001BCE2475|nr:hypothetical protein [Paenibacillus lactis]
MDGKCYHVHDGFEKLRQIGDKVVFTSGDLSLCEALYETINADSKIEDIASAARKLYAEFSAANPNYDNGEFGVEFGVYIHVIEGGTPVYYQLRYNDDFKPDRQEPGNQDLFAVAGRSDEALEHISSYMNRSIPVDKGIHRTYERLANETIGGNLVRFTIKPGGIERDIRPIRESRPLRKWPVEDASLHADMQGNVVARKITLTGTVENSSINTSTITAGTINGGTINGAQIIGGSITSNTDININRDIRVGNNIYLGLTGQTNDRRIEFVDSGPYRSYMAFTNSNKSLEIYSANDLRLTSGLDITISGMSATLPYSSYIGSPTSSNRIVVQSDLANKSDRSITGYNLAFDSTTRNLKLFSATGTLLATVNIPK